MARGANSKNEITNIILNTFKNSFIYGKEIRIPIIEEGEEIQIKVTLTAAKVNVNQGEDIALPGEQNTNENNQFKKVESEPVLIEISQEEKDNIQNLLKSIGL